MKAHARRLPYAYCIFDSPGGHLMALECYKKSLWSNRVDEA